MLEQKSKSGESLSGMIRKIALVCTIALFYSTCAYGAYGAAVYKAKCAPCHGASGQGTAMAPSFKGNDYVKNTSERDLEDVILKGRERASKKYKQFAIGMPKQKLSESELKEVISHIQEMAGVKASREKPVLDYSFLNENDINNIDVLNLDLKKGLWQVQVQIDEGSNLPPAWDLAIKYFKDGEALYGKAKYETALKAYEQALIYKEFDGEVAIKIEKIKTVSYGRSIKKEKYYETHYEEYFPQKRIEEVRALLLPPDLVINSAIFIDNNGLLPNGILDPGESAEVLISISNSGKGPALETVLDVDGGNKNINVEWEKEIGYLASGESKQVRVKLHAGLDLDNGKAAITFGVRERRGYDAQKVAMYVPIVKLQKPELKIINIDVNDGNTGLARGNGNGVPESGETVELTAFIKNQGVGTAFNVQLKANGQDYEIKWGKDSALAGNISQGEIVKATTVFTIPRDFDAKAIKVLFTAEEARKVGSAERSFSFAFSKQTPVLSYEFRLVSKGKELLEAVNGEEYDLELTVRNEGKISARDVVVSLSPETGLNLSSGKTTLGELGAGESKVMRVSLSVPRTFTKSRADLGLNIAQSDFGPVANSFSIPIEVRKPSLKYIATLKTRSGAVALQQGEKGFFEVMVINDGNLMAAGVKLRLRSNNDRLKIIGKSEVEIGKIPPGSRSPVERFQIFAFRGLKPGEETLGVDLVQDDFKVQEQHYVIMIREEGLAKIEVAESPVSAQTIIVNSELTQNLPSINVFNLKDTNETTEGNVKLKFEAFDRKGLEVVKVVVNGRIVVNERTDQKSKQLSVDVSLNTGDNFLTISAYNNSNEYVVKELKITRENEVNVDQPRLTSLRNPDAVAVIIGISKYKNKSIPEVLYARHDAETVKKYLVDTLGFREENVYEFYDENATSLEIKSFMRTRLKGRIKQGRSDVFIFYSGHGIPEGTEAYFAPYDLISEDVRFSGYAVNDLYEHLADLKARSVTVVMDACFSGASGGEKSLPIIKNASPLLLEVSSPMLKVDNGVVFASSSGKQLSSWYAKKQHGIFTYYFLLGLRGKADADADGKITAKEMEEYLTKNVPEKALNLYDRQQIPEVSGEKDRVLVSY